ncbi:MAG: VWA domain-containing protein [Actinomycetales bacterium]|nr:VWA domain-containing protein [Actinomycetales bacterium]
MSTTTYAALTWPWLPWAALGALALVLLLGWLLPRGRASGAPVANTESLWRSPAVRPWVLRYRAWRVAALAVVGGTLLVAANVAAQPVVIEERSRILANRDIVLCLDVSGSMADFGAQVADTFLELVDSFEGERIAMSVFNSTSATIFPLTDDYDLVRERLREGRRALDNPPSEAYWEFVAGVDGIPDEASLIGDGLASCILLFDQFDAERSRSIIFSTDNAIYGSPVYTLPQATDLAISRGAVVHGLFGDDPRYTGQLEKLEFRAEVERTGGLYFELDDPSLVEAIIADVQSYQEVDMEAEPERVRTDANDSLIRWLVLGVLGVLLVGWRLRS